jgi:hypothetical protein
MEFLLCYLNMQTYRIERRLVAIPQASWKWQKRGAEKLYAVPTLMESYHPLNKGVIKLRERTGAMGVTERSKNYIWPFSRANAERAAHMIGCELIPHIGGESGPWFTKSA